MRPHLPHLILLLKPLPFTLAYIPSRWGGFINPGTVINTSRMRDRSPSILVTGGPDTPHIADIIGTCKNEQGSIVSKSDCQYSVLSTGMSMGLSVLAYHQPTYWAGAFGPNGNNKRAVSLADDFLALLPSHLSISSIKLKNIALPADPSSPSLHRRKSGAKEYNVYYNGSLPLTFVVLHKTGSGAALGKGSGSGIQGSEEGGIGGVVPIFAATDGSRMVLSHITEISQEVGSSMTQVQARSGFNGYNHIGAGGIRLLGNSDPVASWADTVAWLNGHTEANGLRPYDYVLTMAGLGSYMGHSLMNNVHDLKGNAWGYNGQFGMQGEWHGFSPDWESDFNWCFGAYRTNC